MVIFAVFFFPQRAKLLGFLLQIYDELDLCVLEGMLVPLQGAA